MAKDWDTIVEEVAAQLYKQKLKGTISPAMVKKQAAKLMEAVNMGFGDAGSISAQDKKQIEALQKNVYVFSGFKNHAQLKECTALLLDDKGNVRPFADFLKDVKAIDKTYNKFYLQAEYQHAQASSMMISKWNDIEQQSEALPFLQYDAVMDDRTRDEHRALNKVTKRWDDPFWKLYYPPNGWNCRCEVRQLAEATEDKEVAIPNVPPMFRNNVGIDGIIFPDTHPYFNDVAKAVADNIKAESVKLIPSDIYEIVNSNPDFKIYKKQLQFKGLEKVHPELDLEQATSIHGYSDVLYMSLNKFLRQSGKFSSVELKYLSALNEMLNLALDTIKTPFKGFVYRGTTLTEVQLEKYQIGKVITEDGFASTSVSAEQSFPGNVKFIIKSKTGKNITKISAHPKEMEVLFKSGQKFKVIDRYESNGITTIELRQL